MSCSVDARSEMLRTGHRLAQHRGSANEEILPTGRNQMSRAINGAHASEIELLLCGCRIRIDAETAKHIRETLQKDVDWTRLVQASIDHGVTALLFRGLLQEAGDQVPPDIANGAVAFIDSQRKSNQFFAAELVRIVRQLQRNGVAAMPFKGPVLAQMAYGDLGLRTFSDLDFLVREQDIPACLDTLGTLEYEVALDLSPVQEAAFRKYSYHYFFLRKDRRIAVEAHWAFAPRSLVLRINYAGLWQRAQQLNLAGETMPSFCLEDQLMILCVHGSKHLWDRLQMVCDVAEMLQACPSLDWLVLFERARSQGCLRMLLLGLTLANRLMEVPLPAQAQALIARDRTVVDLANRAQQSLFCGRRIYREVYELSRFRLRMHDGFRDQIPYFVRTVASPRRHHIARIRLPEFLFFVYYPIKLVHDYFLLPIWLAGKYLVRHLRRV